MNINIFLNNSEKGSLYVIILIMEKKVRNKNLYKLI